MPASLEDILGFDFKKDVYSINAAPSFDGTVIKSNISRLHKCTQDLLESESSFSYEDFRKALEIIRKAYLCNTPAQELVIEQKLLRSLSYNLGLEEEYDFIKYVVRVFEVNWSIKFAKGLLHSLLHDWESATVEARIALSSSIVSKLQQSDSKSAKLLLDVTPYIQENGPMKLGAYLRVNKLPFSTAMSLFYIPESKLGYSYFSWVIISYFMKMDRSEIGEATRILKLHNNLITDKRMLPLMIINNENKLNQDLVDFAICRIGDPSIDSKWAPFEGATKEESDNLEKARKIIMAFLSGQVINIFFKQLCDDPDRKRFWLKHTKRISDFKVYGPLDGYNTMSNYVDSLVLKRHYHRIPATKNSTFALIMYFGEYAVVEFSVNGNALYVYKHGSPIYNNVFGNHIEKTDDLKVTSMNMLVEEISSYWMDLKEEGRMVHIGHWEKRMESWLNKFA